MPELKDYNIMISHSWDYSTQYQTVCGWLDSAKYFKWSNFSIPITNKVHTSDDQVLAEKISNKIKLCHCIIVLSGMYADYSEWMKYEMDTAIGFKVPIIGVEPWGQERVPSEVSNRATVMVGWNSASVINAVRNYAK